MVQLHDIKPVYKRKKIKRIGRGGKRGTYSGRGMKGQRARSGHRIRPAMRDFIQRLPKLRGIKFKGALKPIVVNLDDLERRVKQKTVTKEVLYSAGLIKHKNQEIKILSDGEVKRAFIIKGLRLSLRAKEKILAVGGKVENSSNIRIER